MIPMIQDVFGQILSEDDKAVLDAYLRKLKNKPEDDGGEGQP
jgi:hypothetical protein